ncbi:MAG: hypothetical protein R3B72_23525 [Polyangiaceae bacterium]
MSHDPHRDRHFDRFIETVANAMLSPTRERRVIEALRRLADRPPRDEPRR